MPQAPETDNRGSFTAPTDEPDAEGPPNEAANTSEPVFEDATVEDAQVMPVQDAGVHMADATLPDEVVDDAAMMDDAAEDVDGDADAGVDGEDGDDEYITDNPFCAERKLDDGFCRRDGGNVACEEQAPDPTAVLPNGCWGGISRPPANCVTVEELAPPFEIQTVEVLSQTPTDCSWDNLQGVDLTLEHLCLAYEQRRYKSQRCQELVMEVHRYREDEYQWQWRADVAPEAQSTCWGSGWAYVTACTNPSYWDEHCSTTLSNGDGTVSMLPYCWTGDPALAPPGGVSDSLQLLAATWCTEYFGREFNGMRPGRGPGREAFLMLGPHVCDGVLP